ncbi:putative molybdenum carrier protein [Candidatus Uabimicrobium amorphum]|uniref:Molybdenum cofactor carrier n=1 Tax=Uabimicrobium amorphum TaxID=2596890 RepID=A0A5S9F2I0_UABAM|nr:putative molybdenum carrier protein [Candidatus Uabimicrobium amorphum]BBM83492.1 hypothetical protein UABAM_01844 [Candidatus Uabimicrobium amorphum]
MIQKIISGGQTGADRGGLDAAIKLNIDHGGWCPKGRRAEDGSISSRYHLKETAGRDYRIRTEKNVVDADLTLVFTPGKATGGSLQTIQYARKHNKNCYHFDILCPKSENMHLLHSLLVNFDGILNIAGSRESKFAGIRVYVENILCKVIADIQARKMSR